MESLQIMTKTDGHKEERYDPTNKKQIRDIKKMIKEKLEDGYYLYGAKKEEGTFMVLKSAKDIDDEKLNRFLLTKHVKKRLIAKPVIGG